MGGIEKKKIWTGAFHCPSLDPPHRLGTFFTLSLMVLVATFSGTPGILQSRPSPLEKGREVRRNRSGLIFTAFLACGNISMTPLFLVLILLILSVLFMGTSQNLASTITPIGISLFGILYIGFLLSYVSLIRNLPNGKQWALFLILTVWAGDISAFSGWLPLRKAQTLSQDQPEENL